MQSEEAAWRERTGDAIFYWTEPDDDCEYRKF